MQLLISNTACRIKQRIADTIINGQIMYAQRPRCQKPLSVLVNTKPNVNG